MAIVPVFWTKPPDRSTNIDQTFSFRVHICVFVVAGYRKKLGVHDLNTWSFNWWSVTFVLGHAAHFHVHANVDFNNFTVMLDFPKQTEKLQKVTATPI